MYYVLEYKKTNYWKLFRKNKRIKVYNNKDAAESDALKLGEEIGFKFRLREIKIHPKSRGSPLWKKKYQDIA